MFVHTVYFWLDKNLAEDERADFLEGLETLRKVDGVLCVLIGPPAPTKRPAVDRTYDYALTVLTTGIEGYQVYQNHPIHQAFIERYSHHWAKVVIYDHEDLSQ